MKLQDHLKCVLCFMFSVLCLSSCVVSPANNPSATSEEIRTSIYDFLLTTGEVHTAIPLDPDRIDLPSYDDLCSIKSGMTIEELCDFVGLPQRAEWRLVSPYSGMSSHYRNSLCYIYDSCDGRSLCVVLSLYISDTGVVQRVSYTKWEN